MPSVLSRATFVYFVTIARTKNILLVRIAADICLRRVRRDEGNSTCAQRYLHDDGGALLFVGMKILVSELRLPYPMAPWWVFALIFGLGGLFACGRSVVFFSVEVGSWVCLLVLFAAKPAILNARPTVEK